MRWLLTCCMVLLSLSVHAGSEAETIHLSLAEHIYCPSLRSVQQGLNDNRRIFSDGGYTWHCPGSQGCATIPAGHWQGVYIQAQQNPLTGERSLNLYCVASNGGSIFFHATNYCRSLRNFLCHQGRCYNDALALCTREQTLEDLSQFGLQANQSLWQAQYPDDPHHKQTPSQDNFSRYTQSE